MLVRATLAARVGPPRTTRSRRDCVHGLYSDAVADATLRIGELSRRSGVSPELLRAWERRYGLLSPTRSAGGLRLYSLDDLERVRVMQQHLAAGLAAAEAAAEASRAAPDGETRGASLAPDEVRAELGDALRRFDEPRAQTVIDRALAAASLDVLLVDVLLPYLRELGDRWQRGEASVAEEHFASGVIRGRMLGLARGWGRGLGPAAVLACLPGEQHELGLIAFGLALRERGWRVAFLGGDTPLETIEHAGAAETELVVLSAVTPARVRPIAAQLRAVAGRRRVALGGAVATQEDAEELGMLGLPGDPVSEAGNLTKTWLAA